MKHNAHVIAWAQDGYDMFVPKYTAQQVATKLAPSPLKQAAQFERDYAFYAGWYTSKLMQEKESE